MSSKDRVEIMTKEKFIPLGQIVVGKRFRDPDPEKVEEIAMSISQTGLIHAITIRPLKDGLFELVAGGHRLEAHRVLGEGTIRCFIRELSDDEAHIIEIEENFFTNAFNALERIEVLPILKSNYEAKFEVNKAGGDRGNQHTGGKSQSLAFARFTKFFSEQSDRSESSVKDDLAIGNRLHPSIFGLLKSTSVAKNASQLKALGKFPEDDQIALMKLIASGEAKSLSEARAEHFGTDAIEISPKEKWFNRMDALWAKGDKRWQKKFLDQI